MGGMQLYTTLSLLPLTPLPHTCFSLLAAMTATTNEAGGGFLRTRLRSALHTSNDLLSGLSSNISSRLSVFSVASGNSNASSERSPPPPPPPAIPEKPPSTPPLQLPPSPEESHRSPTMKEMFKVNGRRIAIIDNLVFVLHIYFAHLFLIVIFLFHQVFILKIIRAETLIRMCPFSLFIFRRPSSWRIFVNCGQPLRS